VGLFYTIWDIFSYALCPEEGEVMVTVLGVYGWMSIWSEHEGSAVIVRDGKILAAIEEDRITRVKHDGQTPAWNSVKEVMRISKVSPQEIDSVAVPWESPERTYLKSLGHPNLGKRLLAYPHLRWLRARLQYMLEGFGIRAPLYYVNHHEAHAASAFLTSGLNRCNIITLDGSGDRHESISVWNAQQNDMKQIGLVDGPTFGDFFMAATYAVGFRMNDGEGKTMGLASYGDPAKAYGKIENLLVVDGLKVKGVLKTRFGVKVDVTDNKPFAFYRYTTAKRDNPLIDLCRHHRNEDVAASAQKLLEDKVTQLARNVVTRTGERRLCLSGGVTLNMRLNQRIREMPEVEEVFVFPNPGDGGAAVGAALLVCKRLMERNGNDFPNERITHTYYGTDYTDEEVVRALEEYRLDYHEVRDPEKVAAELIADGKVVGWFQGRLEFGPRALGNRSVLADPRNQKMKDRINKYLKKRDWFMPFAPSIISEAKHEYLEKAVEAPFMIMGFNVKQAKLKEIPAVVHVDGTVRPQTVAREVNQSYWRVIKEFEKLSGVPVILNTSFNRHGQPIVRSPEDAALHVIWGCVEHLIIHKYLVDANVKLDL
jgi:carbamoyltransferase